ncbi:MAG: protein kinase, partial [Planctomycetes bacterium]|nr:protein kinase [Planctomycetota bacterium]
SLGNRPGANDATCVRPAGTPAVGAAPAGRPPAAAPPAPPPRVGHNDVIREEGRGGMGIVYQAWDPRLARTVAIKVLTGAYDPDDPRVLRFQREARTTATVKHARIVQIHEIGESDGRLYIVMDFIAGRTLHAELAEGKNDLRTTIRRLQQVAEALAYAHGLGVVHRDIKPENILIDESGQPIVTDFGLAKNLGEASRLTESGTVVGTPAYMAPEQAQGSPDGVGPAADIYALGAILYEVLARRPVFDGASVMATLYQVVHEEVTPPSRVDAAVPRDLEAICLRCLEKEPARRYPDAAALAQDLEHYLAGLPISARRASVLGRWTARLRRSPMVAALTAVSGLLLIIIAGLAWSAWTRGAGLDLACSPPDLALRLDDRPLPLDRGAASVELAPGAHRLAARAPGYEPWEATVDLARGERRSRRIDLVQSTGALSVRRAPATAAVTVHQGGGERRLLDPLAAEAILAAGPWRLRAVAPGYFPYETTAAVPARGRVAVPVVLDPLVNWEFSAAESIYATPQLRDYDGDGLPDVWMASRDLKGRVLSGLDGRVLAEWPTPRRADSSLASADLDGDGAEEVIFGGDDGMIRAWSLRRGAELWSVPAGGVVLASPLLVDLDADGVLDVVMGSLGERVTAVSGRTGRVVWTAQIGQVAGTACALRVAGGVGGGGGGGPPDVVVATHQAGVFRLRGGDGQVVWRAPLKSGCYPSPALADLDGDGVPEALVAADDGTILALRTESGAVLWRGRVDGPVHASPVVADLDGRAGAVAIVPTMAGEIRVLEGKSGRELRRVACGEMIGGSPALADLNGDGVLDVVVSTEKAGSGRVLAWSGATWEPLFEWAAGTPVVASPVVGDLNGDGRLEIVACTYGKQVVCLEAGPPARAWSCPVGAVETAPLGGSLLLVDGAAGVARAIDPRAGAVAWESPALPGDVLAACGRAGAIGGGGAGAVAYVATRRGIARLAEGGAGRGGAGEAPGYDFREIPDLAEVLAVPGPDGASRLLAARAREVCLLDGAAGGGVLWTLSSAAAGMVLAPRALAVGEDLDGDGLRDLVVHLDNEVRLVSQRDGKALWATRCDQWLPEVRWVAGAAAAGGGGAGGGGGAAAGVDRSEPWVVCGGARKTVMALSGRTGAVRWERMVPTTVPSVTPIPDQTGDGVAEVLVGRTQGGALALSGADGSVLWSAGVAFQLSVVGVERDAAGGKTTLLTWHADSGVVLFLDAATGRVTWRQRFPPGGKVFRGADERTLLVSHPAGLTYPLATERVAAALPWPRFRHDVENSGTGGR